LTAEAQRDTYVLVPAVTPTGIAAVAGDSCCGGAYEISLQTWFGNRYTKP